MTENFKILSTDDEKIKSFGEIFTNDSSREILQLLFNEELSATQIAQKSKISLQLVKYHLAKLQSLDVVKISKIEKNSKSQDMKIYTALKFSLVIVPPTLSEKTRESKSLVRSFKYIYKVMGLGLATGLSGLLSLSEMPQDNQPKIDVKSSEDLKSPEQSDEMYGSPEYFSGESVQSKSETARIAESEHVMENSFSEDLKYGVLDDVDSTIDPSVIVENSYDLHVIFAIISMILGGITIYYFYKFFKKS